MRGETTGGSAPSWAAKPESPSKVTGPTNDQSLPSSLLSTTGRGSSRSPVSASISQPECGSWRSSPAQSGTTQGERNEWKPSAVESSATTATRSTFWSRTVQSSDSSQASLKSM